MNIGMSREPIIETTFYLHNSFTHVNPSAIIQKGQDLVDISRRHVCFQQATQHLRKK